MDEKPYSKREQDAFQKDMRESLSRIEVNMANGFEETHVRQDKTNGRVRLLEKWMWALGGTVVVLIPLGLWLLSTTFDLKVNQAARAQAVDLIR